MSKSKYKSRSSQANSSIKASNWMFLIALGSLFELAGRFFGYRENPSRLWLEPAPLLVTITAALVIVYGAFLAMKSWDSMRLPSFRRSVLCMFLGSTMLVSSMLGKAFIPIIFN